MSIAIVRCSAHVFLFWVSVIQGRIPLTIVIWVRGYQKHRDSKTTGKPKTRRYSKYADTQNTEILKTWGAPKTQGHQHHRCDCDGGKTLEVINQRTGD